MAIIFAGKSHGQRSLAGYSPWGCKRVTHDLAIKQQKYNYKQKRPRPNFMKLTL